MIITYSKKSFVEDYEKGIKLHTFRKDPNERWKPGMTMHQWYRNPRSKGRNSDGVDPYHFATDELQAKERVLIINDPKRMHGVGVIVEGNNLNDFIIGKMIKADGFKNPKAFRLWFLNEGAGKDLRREYWSGWTLHWTNVRYSI